MGRGGEERFKREGRILARLAHPHIAELVDAGVSLAVQPYLVLEHVEGRHIDAYCADLFLDVLAAVAHAHANLIVHRDPDIDGKTATVLTREGGAILTPAYAAPEQLTGAPMTTATDVYARGVLRYVLLTGRHPSGLESPSPADLVKAIVDIESPPLSDAVRACGSDDAQARARAATCGYTPGKLHRLLTGC